MVANSLQTPIEYLKGVGSHRADLIKKELQLFTINDLIHFYPYKYLDRTKYYKINELQPHFSSDIQIIGKIIHIKKVAQKRGSRLAATFTDGTSKMELIWFQSIKYIEESLKINVPYVIFGKIKYFAGQYSMPHPDMELLEEHRKHINLSLQPVYSSTDKLSKSNINSKYFQKLIYQALEICHRDLIEMFSEEMCHSYHLISKKEAVLQIHFPKSPEHLAKAEYRLKFEELFLIQLQLLAKNIDRKQKIKGFEFPVIGELFNTFYSKHLPFPLTNAQKRVIKEIRNDLSKPVQMNRLLQGDVGSGKTIVAFLCMLIALENNFQACLMAPTEILANQHFIGIAEWAYQLNIRIELLTGSTKAAARKQLFADLENGDISILIGTHALLEDKVRFQNLGLAVIDEQHRFGVDQRAKLWHKNHIPPHILVMTATPIPRTLAMSLYGDLDVSVIDELPPGRKPIQTLHYFEGKRLVVHKFVRDEIAKGRQAYIVFPLIEESETLDYRNLMQGYEAVSREFPLPKYTVSIVHGQMTPQEKEVEMARFIKGETNIMIATTVIEVGVNVPNASMMIIESAERFGLSQLHQLRGRVGRGAEQSYCILMTGDKLSHDSKIRMQTMVNSNDGFEIAEVDLKLRGPGNLMGTQQSGIMNLRIADLVKDQQILQWARRAAVEVLQKDIKLEKEEHQILKRVFLELSKKNNVYTYIS